MAGNSTLFPAEKEATQKPIMNPTFFAGAKHYNVPVTTLSHMMRKYGITCVSMLKVDVEGAEELVLQGITDKSHWLAMRQIAIEVHCVQVQFIIP